MDMDLHLFCPEEGNEVARDLDVRTLIDLGRQRWSRTKVTFTLVWSITTYGKGINNVNIASLMLVAASFQYSTMMIGAVTQKLVLLAPIESRDISARIQAKVLARY